MPHSSFRAQADISTWLWCAFFMYSVCLVRWLNMPDLSNKERLKSKHVRPNMLKDREIKVSKSVTAAQTSRFRRIGLLDMSIYIFIYVWYIELNHPINGLKSVPKKRDVFRILLLFYSIEYHFSIQSYIFFLN